MNTNQNKQYQQIALTELLVDTVSISEQKSFQMKYGVFETEFGPMLFAAFEGKIAIVEFSEAPEDRKGITFEQDNNYLQSLLKHPLQLLLIGTPFQIEVWKALLTLTEPVTYSALAAKINRPTATRAVASAVARNKITYFVPCHRVVPASGGTGNYHWGAEIKRLLLSKKL